MQQYQPTPQYGGFRPIQEMFPQPQGSVYAINSPVDIGNVPIGSTGLSVAICFEEQLMYIKSFQNGAPVIMAYSIAPYSNGKKEPEKAAAPSFEERLSRIEQMLTKQQESGGKFDELLQ